MRGQRHTLSLGDRRATWSTALSSVRLIFSPLNMASIFFLSFARSARLTSSCAQQRSGRQPLRSQPCSSQQLESTFAGGHRLSGEGYALA